MSGIQKFLGLSVFKKKEAIQIDLNEETVSQKENALALYKDDEKKECFMVDDIDPRKKEIPLKLMRTQYAYLTSNQFTCFHYANGNFTYQEKRNNIAWSKLPFETIKIKDTSEVKDVLLKESNNSLCYFRFIKDENTHEVIILFYGEDKFDKSKISCGPVVRMDLKTFDIDRVKEGTGCLENVFYYIINNMIGGYITVTLDEQINVFKELYLFLGLKTEYEI